MLNVSDYISEEYNNKSSKDKRQKVYTTSRFKL